MIKKRLKCKFCNILVEENGKCTCGKIYIKDNQLLTEAKIDVDYEDQSDKLLLG